MRLSSEFTVSGSADFYAADPARIDYRDVLDEYRMADDSCIVEPAEIDPYSNPKLITVFENDRVPNFNYSPMIDAGELIPIQGPDGPFGFWSSLTNEIGYRRLEFDESISSNGLVIPPVPGGLSLNVPGSDFPGFTDIKIPYVDEIFGLANESGIDRAVTESLLWTPGTDASARIRIVDLMMGNAGAWRIRCMLIDDGEFAYPQTVLEAVGRDASMFGSRTNISRVAFTFARSEDSALIVMNRSGPE